MAKYIHASDVHEDYDALAAVVDFAQAKSADKVVISGDFNLKGYTGKDIETFKATRNYDVFRQSVLDETKRIYAEFRRILDAGVPYLVIPGNYDTCTLNRVFGGNNLNRLVQDEGAIRYFGYGGGKQTPTHIANLEDLFSDLVCRFDEQELYHLLCQEEPAIAIIHQPPYGSLDYTVFQQHWGTKALRQYIEERTLHGKPAPKLLLVGHVHEDGPYGNNAMGFKGIDKLEETVVVNSGNLGRFELIDPSTMQPITAQLLCRGRNPIAVPETEKILDWGTFSEIDTAADGKVKRVTFYSIMNPDKKKVDQIKEIARYDL